MRTKLLYLAVVVAAGVIVLRVFVFEAFFVRGESMDPTIQSGDYVLVNKLAYLRHGPEREDIVVAVSRVLPDRIVKRVIGLPGERFSIEDGHVVIRNERGETGAILDESYLTSSYTEGIGLTKTVLDPKEYFVLGDNRSVSIDSRELGVIDGWDIQGRVFGVIRFKSLKYIGF